jgi:hypothetical protein
MPSAVLVDGFTGGTWRVARAKGGAVLAVHLFKGVAADGVAEEVARLLRFLAPGDTHDIRFVEADRGSRGSAESRRVSPRSGPVRQA